MKGFICVLLLSLFIFINGYPASKEIKADAFRQSQKLLKLAATEIVETVTSSDYFMWKVFPERKKILLNILSYENLVKFPGKDEIYKNGVLLSMDHQVNPNLIMIYKPFFVMYAGTAESEFEKKVVEVKKDLLMEASLTWGFNEMEAEAFANDFLQLKGAPKKLRPENSVFVNRNYCSCLNGKPDINNQCESYCRGTDQGPTLYGSVVLGEKIILDKSLGSLERWCNADLSDVPDVPPKCVLEVYDGRGTEYLDMELTANGNDFKVNLNTLKYNVTYVARIVEVGSGTNNAASNTFQIRRIPPPSNSIIYPGPLKITPVSQYSCITRFGQSDPNTRSNYFDLKAENHYYYDPRQKPRTAPPNPNFFCYDIDQYGPIDRISIPRLGLIPQAFNLWDQTDIRFSDTNGDGLMDINTLIDEEMLTKWGITVKTDYFTRFKWPTAPSTGESEEVVNILGYMMRVFIDPYTGVGKCPTQEDYFGPDITFKALRNVVGVDTEAIYLGARDKETLNNPDGSTVEMPPDMILIKESLLKKIWFYYEGNLLMKPDDVTSAQMTLHFYYPPAPGFQDPYIQKSYQTLYTIRDRNSLYVTSEAEGSTVQGLPSYDKRFGCVPKGTILGTTPNNPIPTDESLNEGDRPSGAANTNPTPKTPESSSENKKPLVFSSDQTLDWYSNKNEGVEMTLNQNSTNPTYIRGTLIDKFLNTTDPITWIANWTRNFCLIVNYNDPGLKSQLRARATPITITNHKDNTNERILRIDWSLAGKNAEFCKGELPTINQLGEDGTFISKAAFSPKDLCHDCIGSIGSANISLYFENLSPNGESNPLTTENRIPLDQFDPSILNLRVDYSGDKNTFNQCTRSFCVDNGYDCCIENQCVKDKTEKIGAVQSPNYLQSVKDIEKDPSSILNYPYLYNICAEPSEANPVTGPEESDSEFKEAQLRFSMQKAQYLCQEEGKKSDPNFELFCNDKYLCTNLWKTTEPTFDGNCADLDRRDGLERYKENKIAIWKLCGCQANPFPTTTDDKRCPDFNFKATRNTDGDILDIICTANQLPQTSYKLSPLNKNQIACAGKLPEKF